MVQVEVEIGPSNPTSPSTVSLESNRLRSVTVQPSPVTERKAENQTSVDLSTSKNLKEFTLTVQASIEEST